MSSSPESYREVTPEVRADASRAGLLAGMKASWERWGLSWNLKMARLLKGREGLAGVASG